MIALQIRFLRSLGFATRLFVLLWLGCTATLAQSFSDQGFTAETVTTLPPYKPVGLAFAPDGRMFIWQKNGVVRIYKNGALLATPFIDLSSRVNTYLDRGLLGLALDPDFATNGYVYLLYAYEPNGQPNNDGMKTARLTRVRADPANPDVALAGSETIILGSIGNAPCPNPPDGSDCIASEGNTHSIGTARFGPDGKLYVSIGDGTMQAYNDPVSIRAQNLDSYNGKILRINKDGSAPADNPFYDGTNSVRSKIYAYGLRNPYRFAIHPTTGELILGDVGSDQAEEQNRGRGANFGWPCYEGDKPRDGFVNVPVCQALSPASVTTPLYFWDHKDGNAAAVGGAFYTAAQFPAQYLNSYFFADYARGWIKRLTFDGSRQVTAVLPFATGAGAVVTLEQGPDGMLYYIELVSGQVRRIRYSGSAPTAAASATITAGIAPLQVQFSSAGSIDPNGLALSYQWNFGDGQQSNSPNPAHVFTADGNYTVTLTVTNSQNLSATATVKITVGNRPPTATITAPLNGTHAAPGQVVTFQGTADDPDESLTANAMSWQVLLHHDDHIHPQQSVNGATGSFTAEAHGSGTYFYEIILTVTDSGGLKDTRSVNVYVNDHAEPPPANWQDADIGISGPAGSYNVSNGVFTVRGSGYDIVGQYDSFHYVYQPLVGNGQITARLTGIDNTDAWAKAGVMIRESLTRTSRYAMMLVTSQRGAAFQRRLNTTEDSLHTLISDLSAPMFVRLTRQGNLISAYFSANGTDWTLAGSETISLPQTVYIGLAVTSHNNPVLCAATFDQVSLSGTTAPGNAPPSVTLTAPANGATFTAPASITLTASASDADGTVSKVEYFNGATLIGTATAAPFQFAWSNVPVGSYNLTARATDDKGATATSAAISVTVGAGGGDPGPLPAPWHSEDVGIAGPAGSATVANGVFTVKGSGYDIWGEYDSFQFVWQPLSGDGQITARVLSVENTDAWAKAGVMIRESLTRQSRHVMLAARPQETAAFQRRLNYGGDSLHTSVGSNAKPLWLRLARTGNVITAYWSIDGSTWIPGGSETLNLPGTVYIGLVVTSHNNPVLCTAMFDQVSVTAATP